MTSLPHRILQALDRFNAVHPWDHNAHYHRWILRQLPRRFGSALDVGSGTGDLARLLAPRADTVHGVDSDPVIVSRARRLTPEGTAATFSVAEAPTDLPTGPHDVITCVATLHHVPFTEALDTFRGHLAPGGTLVVVGLYRPRTATDHLLGAAAVLPNAALGWLKNRGRTTPRPASMTARTRPADMPFSHIAAQAHTLLPGARLRRRLFWRYTLTWRRPWTRPDLLYAERVDPLRRSLVTVTADRPQMLVTEFEELARHADRSIEGARLEFINGHLGGKAVPDGDHGSIIEWLTRICMQQRPDLWLDSHQGLVVETYREGRARPDGSLVPSHAFAGEGEWADPGPVLMVVEVTSYDSDTDRRDRVDKPRAYAGTGIPVYLLIDRDTCEVKVHSRPDGGRYETVQTLPFGKEVALPEPVGISLDTEPLKNWVR